MFDETTDGRSPLTVPVPAPAELPAQLGERYRTIHRIGAGGMGQVYLAEDTLLGRQVAIKLVLSSEAAAANDLIAEARAMARLAHPNVVTVYEAGSSDGQVFIAMEFVDGQTLRRWLATPRSWREIVAVFAAAGRGLAAAHAAAIVHRDFKPENVLISAAGRVCVSDFGLASLSASGEPAAAAGQLAGTPAYMSPEQRRRESVTDRSDQFSFCVALHEALYGRRPLAGSPTPPAGRRVPRWLQAVVVRGLAEEPSSRFPTMDALVAALGRDPWVRRRRVIVATMALALAATAVGVHAALDHPAASTACAGRVARSKLVGVWDAPAKARLREHFLVTGAPGAQETYRAVEQRLDRWASGWIAAQRDVCLAGLRGGAAHHGSGCLDRREHRMRALARALTHADPAALPHAVAAVDGLESLTVCGPGAAATRAGPAVADPGARRDIHLVQDQIDDALALELLDQPRAALAVARPALAEARRLAYPPALAETLVLNGRLERALGDGAAGEHLREALVSSAEVGDVGSAAEAWSELVALAPPPPSLDCPTVELVAAIAASGRPPCANGKE